MTDSRQLQILPGHLSRLMQRQPRLALALTCAWLDPLVFADPDFYEEVYWAGGFEDDPVGLALSITRETLPHIYAQLVQGRRAGWGLTELANCFEAALQEDYPHLEIPHLYDLGYGVPLTFIGVDVTDVEFVYRHPQLVDFLETYFDLIPVEQRVYNSSYCVIPDEDFATARAYVTPLIRSLIVQGRQPYADLALLLMWAFSSSGNSLVDYSDQDFWEAGYEPLPWDEEHLTIANTAHQELAYFCDAIDTLWPVLDADVDLQQALHDKLTLLKSHTSSERERSSDDDPDLTWPSLIDGRYAGCRRDTHSPDRRTDPDARVAFLWDAYT